MKENMVTTGGQKFVSDKNDFLQLLPNDQVDVRGLYNGQLPAAILRPHGASREMGEQENPRPPTNQHDLCCTMGRRTCYV